ncbi:MAG: hypothetical protein ACKOPS_18625 [Cyanobium sp.]
MDHPLWMLVPWVVFALALGVTAWRFGALIRRQLRASTSLSTAQARQRLERLWQQDQPGR